MRIGNDYSALCPLFFAHTLEEDIEYDVVVQPIDEIEKPPLPSFVNVKAYHTKPATYKLKYGAISLSLT